MNNHKVTSNILCGHLREHCPFQVDGITEGSRDVRTIGRFHLTIRCALGVAWHLSPGRAPAAEHTCAKSEDCAQSGFVFHIKKEEND